MSFYEPCYYCNDWAPGDDLVMDAHGHSRCSTCEVSRCINCHRNDPTRRSNLCVSCALGLGVAPLLDCVGNGVRLEDEVLDSPVIGIVEALFVIGGRPALLFSIPWASDEDEPVGVFTIPVALITRLEVCVRVGRDSDDEIDEKSYERLEAWMQTEYELDAIREWEEVGQWELVPHAEEDDAERPVRKSAETAALLEALGATEEDEKS